MYQGWGVTLGFLGSIQLNSSIVCLHSIHIPKCFSMSFSFFSFAVGYSSIHLLGKSGHSAGSQPPGCLLMSHLSGIHILCSVHSKWIKIGPVWPIYWAEVTMWFLRLGQERHCSFCFVFLDNMLWRKTGTMLEGNPSNPVCRLLANTPHRSGLSTVLRHSDDCSPLTSTT